MVVVLAAVILLPVLRGDERGTLFDTGAATIIDDDAGGDGGDDERHERVSVVNIFIFDIATLVAFCAIGCESCSTVSTV